MSLLAGARLGPYTIVEPIGAGGMGEVYKGRDSRLNRDVAIKVLPASVANEPERLARFGREAQLVAALNHPHIAQVYGLEDDQGTRALVMELVEGPTLAQRIAAGAIPLNEALQIAKQIGEALDAAHEKGIIHRDLKPANIKVRPDGTVKVLDFGLAKTLDRPAAAISASAAISPTLSVGATEAGIILGTAAYMSPEQAVGKPADRRSDLWAFGVVVLEMLTGRSAFSGETISDVLASVLKSDPDWSALPLDTPLPIRRLLRRCLEKDPRRRLESASDARLEIDDAMRGEESVPAPVPRQRLALPVALALATGATIAGLAIWAWMRPEPPRAGVVSRFAITPPPSQRLRISPFESTVALSPDGRWLVYSTWETDTTARLSGTSGTLMIRPLNQLEARPLAPFGRSPFFSPDAGWIGFFDDNDFFMKKVPSSGGSPVNVCRFAGGPRGASWGDDNTIVFATGDPSTGLWRVPAGGGEPEVLTTPQGPEEGDHLFPWVLPGGRGVLFTIGEAGKPEGSQVAVLDGKTSLTRTLIKGGSQAQYVPTGHLVYAVAGTLRAVAFDVDTLTVLGDPTPVVESVIVTPTSAAYYTFSDNGMLAYVPGTAPAQPLRTLVWLDRKGKEQPLKVPSRPYTAARLSPDETQIALEIRDQDNDIWIWDITRETMRKLTDGPALDQSPLWTLDSRQIVYTSQRGGPSNLYVQSADGSGPARRLSKSDNYQWTNAITANGAQLIGHEFGAETSFDLFVLPLARALSAVNGDSTGGAANGFRSDALVREPLAQSTAQISPNGRYVAYQSNEAGRFQIYVRPFPDVMAGKWQVSEHGGTRPAWATNGRELFYIDGARALVTARVETAGSFAWDNPVKLIENISDDFAVLIRPYDVTRDGRFLMLKEQVSNSNVTAAHMIVVANWFEELKSKVPPR